jgi:hypothetical protein
MTFHSHLGGEMVLSLWWVWGWDIALALVTPICLGVFIVFAHLSFAICCALDLG